MDAIATITIARPIAEVFAYVTDVSKMPRWVSGVRAARPLSDRMEVGSRFVLDYVSERRPFQLELEVTEYDPPHVFASRTYRGPFSFEGRIVLREVEEGTEVTNIIEAGPDSVSTRFATWLLGPVLNRVFTKRLMGELEQLEAAMS